MWGAGNGCDTVYATRLADFSQAGKAVGALTGAGIGDAYNDRLQHRQAAWRSLLSRVRVGAAAVVSWQQSC